MEKSFREKCHVITTYRAEFCQCAEELNDQVDGLVGDGSVDDIEELRCLAHNVEGLDIVWLFAKVVLETEMASW